MLGIIHAAGALPTLALAAVTVVAMAVCEGPGLTRGLTWDRTADGSQWPTGHYGPAWGDTADGAVIVFRWNAGPYVPPYERDSISPWGFPGYLYAINEDGTGLTLLSPSGARGSRLGGERRVFDVSPAVSPDGTRAAYATLRHSEVLGQFDIVTVSVDRDERQRLTEDIEGSERAPAWSPDGTRIAFLKDNYLHTMAADGSNVRGIVSNTLSRSEPPAWSPDGTRLAFRGADSSVEFQFEAQESGEAWALYIVGADGSNLTRVAENVVGWWGFGPWGRPAWSPDGRRIAFLNFHTGALCILDVDTGTVETLSERAAGPVLWSPDGAEIFFFYKDPLNDRDTRGLHAISVEGEREIRRVTDFAAEEILGLAWSPDGERLAVLAGPYRTDNAVHPRTTVVLYTVAPDGSGLQVLLRQRHTGKLVAEAAR